MSVDAGGGTKELSKPGDVYLATERLKELFAGVAGIRLVDDSYSCLKGERIRELLEACGVSRGLTCESVQCELTSEDLCDLRTEEGCLGFSYGFTPTDYTLRGLPKLLSFFPSLDVEGKRKRTKLLWEALKEGEQRLGQGAFYGSYSWVYYKQRSAKFDAAFVRQLNTIAWVPDAEGVLQQPEFVVFESLGWEENPVLTSKIRFKPPMIDQLARASGFEPKALELLKKRGLTSERDLLAALGEEKQPEPTASATSSLEGAAATGIDSSATVEDETKSLPGNVPAPTHQTHDLTARAPVGNNAVGDEASPAGGSGGIGTVRPAAAGGNKGQSTGSDSGTASGTTRPRKPGSAGGRPFISYLAARPEEAESDPDGLDHLARKDIEKKAIDFIQHEEPERKWKPTPLNNPGFDLYQGDKQSTAIRWCEVKAMTGGLADRAVGLSRKQFDFAAERGDAYWLYVVERAGTDMARIVRIQNPVGKARTFTFDRGWLDIAEVDSESPDQED